MKKLILFVFVLVVGNVRGQAYYPCSVLPQDMECNSSTYLDTLNLATDTSLIVIDTSNSCNSWTFGHSYKEVFDSIDTPFGIVTDTINSYEANLDCGFILKIPPSYLAPTSLLFFEHKYQTDSLFDGGYLEYSCNQGQTWRNLNANWQYPPEEIKFYNYANPFFNDTIPFFTGTNVDWQWSGIQFIWYHPVMKPDENRWQECQNFPWSSDSLYIRFHFISDAVNNNKAGWMIRNIVIGNADQGGSLPEFSTLPLKLFPNPATEKISIELPPNSGALSSVVISDIAGNVALRATEAREIDVSTLSPGIYFVLVESDKFVFRQKLVKQ
jgi:hypothetical protein